MARPSAMAGRLTAFNDGGVLHTRLLIGLDFGVGAVGCEPIGAALARRKELKRWLDAGEREVA